ncbi:MAG: NAD(P)-binding protein [Caldiserica bacterium]|nr:NAD(P)-binding protein [Caldisericota bacterium]
MAEKVLILGAGMTGLSAGWVLSENGFAVELLEKEAEVGGLARSARRREYIFDYAPHCYHASNPDILQRFKQLAGNEFVETPKDVRIKFRGQFYHYPLQVFDVLRSLNPFTTFSCMADYLAVLLKGKFRGFSDRNAEEWLVNRFGRTLYDIFFGPYSQKVWGIPLSRMSSAFAQHRIPYPSLGGILKNALGRFLPGRAGSTNSGEVTDFTQGHRFAPLVKRLYYPRKGAGFIPEKISQEIKAQGGKISLNYQVKRIVIEKDRVESVVVVVDGKEVEKRCDHLISTIPITELLYSISPPLPEDILRACSRLQFRSVVVVCLGVKRRPVLPAQSLYFTNRTFNRVSDLVRYGMLDCAPEGKTSVIVEITCDEGDRIWRAEPSILCPQIIEELEEEGLIAKDEVEYFDLLRIKYGYPIYALNYEEAIKKAANFFSRISNLLVGGRQGLFEYIDMDISMEVGLAMAQCIIQGKGKKANFSLDDDDVLFC